MFSVRGNYANSSGSSSGFFAQSLRGTFTTTAERKFWSNFIPLEKLGEGSFGSVVAAIRAKDDLPVAIKSVCRNDVTFVEISEDVDEPEEVFALHQLEDVENVIRVIDWKETSDKVIIVLERPQNFIDLKQFMRQKGGRLSEPAAKKIISQLASCVNKFMERFVLHRDLKPSNILVNVDTLEIKVIDFGLFSEINSSEDVLRDEIGTQGYLPPELISRRKFIAGPAMVWTIGIITYQILTGARPFRTNKETCTRSVRIPQRLSADCKSFIWGCLNHFDSRLPIASLQNHSWLSSDKNTVSSPLDYFPQENADSISSSEDSNSNSCRKRKAEDELSWSGPTLTPSESQNSSSLSESKAMGSSAKSVIFDHVDPTKECTITSVGIQSTQSESSNLDLIKIRTILPDNSFWNSLTLEDLQAAKALCLLSQNMKRKGNFLK